MIVSITAIVEALVAAGASPDMILAAVRAAEAGREDALAKRRADDALRARRYRERHVTSREVTVTGRDERDADSARVSVEPLPETSQETPPEKEPLQGSKKRPRQTEAEAVRIELEAVLRPEIAQAVTAHRRAKRAPLTALAAKRLAEQFAQCEDPNEAAATMVEQGWQGFKPEWLARPPPRSANGFTAHHAHQGSPHVRSPNSAQNGFDKLDARLAANREGDRGEPGGDGPEPPGLRTASG